MQVYHSHPLKQGSYLCSLLLHLRKGWYLHLKDQGWTFTKSPTPGSIFSTTNFNHTGIVAGVIDENTMVIVEANFNHKNDTFEEFISLPDWAMRIVPTDYYKKGVGYVYCNPPQ